MLASLPSFITTAAQHLKCDYAPNFVRLFGTLLSINYCFFWGYFMYTKSPRRHNFQNRPMQPSVLVVLRYSYENI